jgi:hypothetical protein
MTRTKSIANLCIVAATVATAVLLGAAAGNADVMRGAERPADYPTHFAGFPPVGVKASTPTTGTLVMSFRPRKATGVTEWNVYADGRIVWQRWTPKDDATVVPAGASRIDTGYVQQRLTLEGVQQLQSKILETGLFEHNLWLVDGSFPFAYEVRVGDQMVTVRGLPSPGPTRTELFTPATPDQSRALASISALVADPAGSLPKSAWADRRVRTFVPSHYVIAIDRGYPDVAKLPSAAGKSLSRFKILRQTGCQVLRIGQARTLLQAFVRAGISPSDNHARNIAFDFAGFRLPSPSYLHLSPALPDVVSTNGRC